MNFIFPFGKLCTGLQFRKAYDYFFWPYPSPIHKDTCSHPFLSFKKITVSVNYSVFYITKWIYWFSGIINYHKAVDSVNKNVLSWSLEVRIQKLVPLAKVKVLVGLILLGDSSRKPVPLSFEASKEHFDSSTHGLLVLVQNQQKSIRSCLPDPDFCFSYTSSPMLSLLSLS